MLRIINQRTEAEAELKRICDRIYDDQITHKEATVSEIVQTVRRQGDKALLHYTAEFDRQQFDASELRVSGAELDAAYQQVSGDLLKAIELAHTLRC
jgi:histidinol dehydrogenase